MALPMSGGLVIQIQTLPASVMQLATLSLLLAVEREEYHSLSLSE